ncbi:response regulator [Maridesulfovibrio sp.]|uniref:ATP-binding response regulator n=1 Tax=Maridesulfovibrio sp. TaxID=2795000 RepID=UPI0029F5195E|nr:response regulator [Maridesulfovibrio sp.]
MSDGFEADLFLAEFVHECREATDLAVQDVLNLEEMHDQDTVDRIFRALHSIKGNSSMLGLMELSKFVHKVEDTCSDIRSGQREIDRKAISVLLKSFDKIEEAFDNIVENGDDNIDYSAGYSLLQDIQSPASEVELTRASVEVPAGSAGPVLTGGESLGVIDSAEPEPAPEAQKTELQEVEAAKQDVAFEVEKIEVRSKPTALVVDDDFGSRKILSTFLSRYMPCYIAKDGVEAIQAFSESLSGNTPRFDIIMLDIMMPNIDGLQACKAIRQLERSRNIDSFGSEAKIFIVSSLSDEKTIHKAVYECHADSFIIKPVTFDALEKQMVRFKLIDPK